MCNPPHQLLRPTHRAKAAADDGTPLAPWRTGIADSPADAPAHVTPGVVSARSASHPAFEAARSDAEEQQQQQQRRKRPSDAAAAITLPPQHGYDDHQDDDDDDDEDDDGEGDDSPANAIDFADYELTNDMSQTAPRPGLGIPSSPHASPARSASRTTDSSGYPSSSNENNHGSNNGTAAAAAAAAATRGASGAETPEFIRRRTALRHVGDPEQHGSDSDRSIPQMESLVRRTDTLLSERRSSSLRSHRRAKPAGARGSTPQVGGGKERRVAELDVCVCACVCMCVCVCISSQRRWMQTLIDCLLFCFFKREVALSPMAHGNPLSWSVSRVRHTLAFLLLKCIVGHSLSPHTHTHAYMQTQTQAHRPRHSHRHRHRHGQTLSPLRSTAVRRLFQVSSFFQSEGCGDVARQCKKRKIAGAALLRLDTTAVTES